MKPETNPSITLSNTDESRSAPDEDAALVLASRNGELDAFELLVTRHQKRMLNIAFRLTGDYNDACEVVQDAFLSAYRNIGTFRGDAKFTTWLTTITVNLSKNRLKQIKARRSRMAFSLDDPIRTEDGTMTVDPPSPNPSVLDEMMKRDLRAVVQECIKKLEGLFREVLVLRDMQDFSYKEIGRILKVREGTVKSRLFRAREMVKTCLKRAAGEL